MSALAMKAFYDGLEGNAAKLVNTADPCGPDLQPTPPFTATIAMLVRIWMEVERKRECV